MASKAKIARSKRGTKGAARTGGKGGKPLPFVPTEKPGEVPVDDEIERAAERAGIGRAELVDDYVNMIRERYGAPEAAFLLKHEAERFTQAARELVPPAPIDEPVQPPPWKLTGAPYYEAYDLRTDTTPADLFHLAFDGDKQDDLLAGAINCALDEFEVLQLAIVGSAEHFETELLARFARRSGDRLKIAVEVARRMKSAAGGAS